MRPAIVLAFLFFNCVFAIEFGDRFAAVFSHHAKYALLGEHLHLTATKSTVFANSVMLTVLAYFLFHVFEVIG
jgi:hypothetical protein